MHELWEQDILTSRPDRARQVADRFKSENWKHLEQWKQDTGETAHQAYLALSEQTGWVDKKEVQSYLGWAPTLTPVLDALYHGFAVHDGSWQRYRWVGDLFREWFLTRRKPEGQVTIELFFEIQSQGASILLDIGRLATSELKKSWMLVRQSEDDEVIEAISLGREMKSSIKLKFSCKV